MRIGIGQIVPSFIPVNYPGYGPIPGYTAPLPPASSPASITLITGKVVSDPTSQAPTGYDCLAYQCGADPNNIAARAWCSQWGQVGAFPCSDPQCAPVASLLDCSTSVVSPVPAPPVQPTPVALTPQNIVQPLPDITAVTDALPAPTPTCSLWCDLNAAIAASPLIAVGLLAGAAVLLWPKKGKR